MDRHQGLFRPLISPREDTKVSLGLCFWAAAASSLCKASYYALINRTRGIPPFTLAQRDNVPYTALGVHAFPAPRPARPSFCPSPTWRPRRRRRRVLAPPRPRPPPRASRPAPPPARGAAPRAPAAPPRASSTQVAGSAVGGAYFPPLCEVEAGGPHAPPARGQLLLGCRRRSRRSLRRGQAGRPAPRGSPCVGGRGRRAAEPPRRSRGAGRRAAPAPARRRDAVWGGLAEPPARDRARLLR